MAITKTLLDKADLCCLDLLLIIFGYDLFMQGEPINMIPHFDISVVRSYPSLNGYLHHCLIFFLAIKDNRYNYLAHTFNLNWVLINPFIQLHINNLIIINNSFHAQDFNILPAVINNP